MFVKDNTRSAKIQLAELDAREAQNTAEIKKRRLEWMKSQEEDTILPEIELDDEIVVRYNMKELPEIILDLTTPANTTEEELEEVKKELAKYKKLHSSLEEVNEDIIFENNPYEYWNNEDFV